MLTPFENYNYDAFLTNVTCEEYYEFSNSYRTRDRELRSWQDYDMRDNFIEDYSERRDQ